MRATLLAQQRPGRVQPGCIARPMSAISSHGRPTGSSLAWPHTGYVRVRSVRLCAYRAARLSISRTHDNRLFVASRHRENSSVKCQSPSPILASQKHAAALPPLAKWQLRTPAAGSHETPPWICRGANGEMAEVYQSCYWSPVARAWAETADGKNILWRMLVTHADLDILLL